MQVIISAALRALPFFLPFVCNVRSFPLICSSRPHFMIRIVLQGRTGNHLFQYALGRVLSKKHQVPLVLDASWFNAEGWSQVSHFLSLPLKARVVRRFSLGARILRKLTGKHYWEFRNIPIYRENPLDQSFDARFLECPSDCLLFGYFQTPRYFDEIAEELLQELRSLLNSACPSREIHRELAQPGTVAVHVRRGDYLQHSVFQVCDVDYYRDAINQMRKEGSATKFFIFSDDPAWCRSTFCDDDQTIVDSGKAGNNPLYDLHLMSLAAHHIIANSTYSWWSAWLAQSSTQRVIMPERWYAGEIIAPIDEKKWF